MVNVHRGDSRRQKPSVAAGASSSLDGEPSEELSSRGPAPACLLSVAAKSALSKLSFILLNNNHQRDSGSILISGQLLRTLARVSLLDKIKTSCNER